MFGGYPPHTFFARILRVHLRKVCMGFIANNDMLYVRIIIGHECTEADATKQVDTATMKEDNDSGATKEGTASTKEEETVSDNGATKEGTASDDNGATKEGTASNNGATKERTGIKESQQPNTRSTKAEYISLRKTSQIEQPSSRK